LDAIFPYARDHLAYPDLLEEGLQPHKVKEVLLWAALEDINYRLDITNTFDIKLAALRCHKSQIGDNQLPDLENWLKQRARKMAEGQDFKLAEAFHRVEVTW
jgi:LmbE family N-acetylglucosaminyl deacetylase